MADRDLEQYEVFLRTTDGYRWTMLFQAESFAHAEEQAIDALKEDPGNEIISIERDW